MATNRKRELSHQLVAVLLCLQWIGSFGSAAGLSMLSDSESGFNLTSAGFAWVSTEGRPESESGRGAVGIDGTGDRTVQSTQEEVEAAFNSIDSLLHWAIGHSDPEKLKGAAQDVQGMTIEQLQKRQSELKELMEKLRVKSDADLMKISLADLQNNSSPTADRQRALQELLLLVEPMDNAIDLNKLDGLAVVIGELERHEEDLRTTAAWVLGQASQNNAVVQRQLLDLGALPKLMRMVVSNNGEEAVKALYAVSALVRNFPLGQEEFYASGGVSLLEAVLSGERGDTRLKKKALFLIADLAEQQVYIEKMTGLRRLNDELLKSIVRLSEDEDLDMQEKALRALQGLMGLDSGLHARLRDVCRMESVLDGLRLQYQELMVDPEQADYIKDLALLRDEVARSVLSPAEKNEGGSGAGT